MWECREDIGIIPSSEEAASILSMDGPCALAGPVFQARCRRITDQAGQGLKPDDYQCKSEKSFLGLSCYGN